MESTTGKSSKWHRIFWILVSLGLLVLVTLSAWTIRNILLTIVAQPNQAASGPVIPFTPTSVTSDFSLPADAQLVVNTIDGEILFSSDGSNFKKSGLKGYHAAVSSQSHTLAYYREPQLRLYQSGKELGLNMFSNNLLPWWSEDGTLLIVRAGGDVSKSSLYVFHVDRSMDSRVAGTMLFSGLSLGGTAISEPLTGQLLLAQNIAVRKAIFYTIDPFCNDPNSCIATRQDIGAVSYNVTWIDYQPGSGHIIFSELTGNIYQMDVATGQVSSLIEDKKLKRHPIFNKDGSRLAYLDDSDQLNIVDFTNKATRVVPDLKIESVDWVN